MLYPEHFDVIVIGGGHAGCDAASASARMGLKTLLVTHNIETIGQLSCNPSMGGIGKGQLVKELDALGGPVALCVDKSAINLKVLNRSKGSAMFGHHAILDRQLYKESMRKTMETQPNLRIFQQGVEDIILEGDKVVGIVTQLGIRIMTHSVVLTAGTFLNGKIHVGLQNYSGGRAGDQPSVGLAQRLKELKLPQGRLKTGTPARIDGSTIDFTKLSAQYSDGYDNGDLPVFSFMGDKSMHPKQVPCFYTRTTLETHDILRSGFDQSPMFTGIIEGVGPRYCPSIEDKITRFADKDSHQIILEPEGLNTHEFYPNGISTSLPFEIQYKAIRSMPGLENAHLTRPGYAIEYDYYDPTSLKQSLESRQIAGLFMAGQIIGSTGYSEASASGIIAGINAGRYVKGEAAWVPQRHEAYLGVLLDDLTTKGVTEPYRMFTSRAEYRLYLREDNADARLTSIGRDLGLVDDTRWEHFCRKQEAIAKAQQALKDTWINPQVVSKEQTMQYLGCELKNEANLAELIKRPDIQYAQVMDIPLVQQKLPELTPHALKEQYGEQLAKEMIEQIETLFKYEGYINRQTDEIAKMNEMASIRLPQHFDYNAITSLSTEVKQKMNKHQPETLGQASRISGITPSAIGIIMIYLKKNKMLNNGSSESSIQNQQSEVIQNNAPKM